MSGLPELQQRLRLVPGLEGSPRRERDPGLTIIAILPYTYLAHIPLAPLAIWLGMRHRQRNAIA